MFKTYDVKLTEEVQRLESVLAKREKLCEALEDEKSKAEQEIGQLKKTQNSMREKEKSQGKKIKQLEQDIEAKNELVSIGKVHRAADIYTYRCAT